MIENPLFIVGTERSGSNLLRLLLNELNDISIPHPPHLMRDLSKVLSRYGNLQDDENFHRLIHDAVRLVDLHFAPWPLVLNKQRIFNETKSRDLYSVYAAVYEQYREHSGKARWGCKSTFMINHVADILEHHARPQFIHLVRDVRDVAVSARRSVFCHYHPYFVAKLWSEEQNKAAYWQSQLPEDTWFTLRYEDLIQQPETMMKEVCGFLGTPYSSDLLKFFDKPAARELSRLSRSWENVGRPVLKDNSAKYRKHLSHKDIRLIESVANAPMHHYGYRLESDKAELTFTPSPALQAKYRTQEELLMWREEGLALFKDRNARYRLLKRSYLLSLRWR
ncbi:MAG: sulfotransferase [Bdellovibrionales bacterium]|nr:sulfotransferase [Bdellovibrionales bacterium]